MSLLLTQIKADLATGKLEPPEETHDERGRRQVTSSKDFKRIYALPRRLMDPEERPMGAPALATLYKPGATAKLNPIQEHVLTEAPRVNGAFVAAGVGHGKTLIGQLLPMVMHACKVAVLLIPPKGRESFANQWEKFESQFFFPNLAMPSVSTFRLNVPTLHVVAYSQLSHESATLLLESLRPDLVVGDEMHCLKDSNAVRTWRFLEYMRRYKATRFVGMSGTVATKSGRDYSHLVKLALGDGSPWPHVHTVVDEWCEATDPLPWNIQPGVLKKFCLPGESARKGIQRRERETEGWLATTESSAPMSLVLARRTPDPIVPSKLRETIEKVHTLKARPDGEEFVEAKDVAQCERQLACGFYYYWAFPRREDPKLIEAWRAIRKEWHRELREKLIFRKPHLDSPLLCTKAAIRYAEGYQGDLPTWNSAWWSLWKGIRDRVQPETRTEWVDDYLAHDAALWAKTHKGIVWCEHEALGRRVAELLGTPYFHGGPKDPDVEKLPGSKSCVLSLHAYWQIKNLVQFSDQLFTTCLPNAARMEQALGRTHRQGQEADEVRAEFYRHTDAMQESFHRAEELAHFLTETKGARMKILFASRENW